MEKSLRGMKNKKAADVSVIEHVRAFLVKTKTSRGCFLRRENCTNLGTFYDHL